MARASIGRVNGVALLGSLLLLISAVAAPPAAVEAQTSSADGQTFTFPWPPDWVARGKYQKMVLAGITGFNPGQWDVHACGTLPDCLMPSSPQFNGLVYHNPVNPDEIVCDLCESWTVSRDGKTYTFRLRQAQWHDGQPVTAEDIKFSLDRIVEPGAIRVRTGVLRTFYEHGSAQVIDPRTIRVPIKFASPLFLENLASEYMKMYPKHVAQGLSRGGRAEAGQADRLRPVEAQGVQAEHLDRVRAQHELLQEGPAVFRRHDLHDRPGLQPPPGGDAGGAGPHHRGADHRHRTATKIPMRIQRETKGRVRAIYIPEAVQTYLVFHMNKPPFQDARVRRAVFLAIDRHELTKIVRCAESFGCFGSVGTFLPNKGGKIVESPEDLAQAKGWRRPKDQDLAEAKALMAAAGHANGFKATLNLGTRPSSSSSARSWPSS